MHYKVEKNATRKKFERELSLEVFAVQSIKQGPFLGRTRTAPVLHTIGQRKVVVELGFKVGHI